MSRFRAHATAAHIELQKGERSELAELAANVLSPRAAADSETDQAGLTNANPA